MATIKHIPAQLREQLRRDREKIATELPELIERGRRLDEAAAENSLCGHLRRAIHRSGRPLKKIAAEVGLDVFVLCDFLEGTRTLRSDVVGERLDGAGMRWLPGRAEALLHLRGIERNGDGEAFIAWSAQQNQRRLLDRQAVMIRSDQPLQCAFARAA